MGEVLKNQYFDQFQKQEPDKYHHNKWFCKLYRGFIAVKNMLKLYCED